MESIMSFEKRLDQIQFILRKLARQPMRWTPLVKVTIQVCGSPPRLYYILKFLEKKGFIAHENIEEKLHWKITEKGKELLNVLSKI